MLLQLTGDEDGKQCPHAEQCDRLLAQLSFKRVFQFVFLISVKMQPDDLILGRILSTASVTEEIVIYKDAK